MMVAALIILAMLNWQMALVGVFIIPLLYISIKFFAPRIEKSSDDVASATSEIYNESNESIENATLIQSFNRQDFQTQKLKGLFEDRARKNIHLSLLDSFFDYANNIATAAGTAIVLILGGYGVFNHTLTLGELIIFITYMSYLYDPLENILNCIGTYKTLLAGVKQVHEVQSEIADIPDATTSTPIGTIQGSIILKDIFFTRGEKVILDHINLEITPGQKVAFVGPSGSGKSTILSLLPRFNRATSGFIYLDGKEIRELNLAELRNQFGVVSQEPELLTGTIHENIGFATPNENLDMPDIIVAAQAANAYDFIKKLPDEFETQVGEGGSYLSGGQKQRISLARAFVKNPPILLLDEPTSALDRVSTSKIIAAIKKLMVGKTVLLATHEISLLKEMDVVYIIDGGKIAKISDQIELDTYIDTITKQQESSDLYKFS